MLNINSLLMKKIIIISLSFLLYSINIVFSQTYTEVFNVKTPNGSTVQDTYQLTSSDLSFNSSQIATMTAYYYNNYNEAVLIEPDSYKYNCHGYAWHVSEGGNKVWIGRYYVTSEDIYWNDYSYTEVDESIATKVSYHQDGNHSAIRLNSTWYQSKWGWGGPLIKHHPNDVDLIYQPSKTKKYYVMPIFGSNSIYFSGESYSLNSSLASGTVNWSVSPSGSFSVSNSTGTSTKVLKNSTATSGTATLTASVGGKTYYRTITAYSAAISGPSTVNKGSTNTWELPLGATSYSWNSVYMTPWGPKTGYTVAFTTTNNQTSDIVECIVTLNGVSTFFDKFITVQ